jgi:hypothetical protein
MKITIEIPKEYEDEFINNKFKESLNRVYVDLDFYKEDSLCGLYERETIDMLMNAFQNGIIDNENELLKKRIKELEKSNRNWRRKCQRLRNNVTK